MSVALYPHQIDAIEKMKNGCILVGGVGSGKSITSLAYYHCKVCGGEIKNFSPMVSPIDLYIITTARKRDSLEWDKELIPFLLSRDENLCHSKIKVIIDSWNNIRNYKNIAGAMFIFDEQKISGAGAWVKSFLNITRKNKWILLSATPGDVWTDFIPVFVANGFYKNRTEFIRRHIVYSNFSKYPKIDHYIEIARLVKLREEVIVRMHFDKHTIPNNETILCEYDRVLYNRVAIDRWNIYEDRPIKDISELFYIMRKVVNSDISRLSVIKEIYIKHRKVIIFYNFDYELELLRQLGIDLNIMTAEWNGHLHQEIPNAHSWLYFVQYYAGAEAWNCIETDSIVFYSQSYSYKTTIQAAGRIDRLNTPYTHLYYYYLKSRSPIDLAIHKALKNKQNFNENKYYKN